MDPDEYKEHLEELKELASANKLALIEVQRGLYDLFEELEQDQLERLKLLLTVLSGNEDPGRYASYWSSWCQGRLYARFDVHPVATMFEDVSPEDFV